MSLAIDLDNIDFSQLISMKEAAARCDVSVSAVWRWYLYGLQGVELATVKKGGRRYTTDAALQDFFQRLNSSTPDRAVDQAPNLTTANQAALIERELKAKGW